jgi:hypothetical protein
LDRVEADAAGTERDADRAGLDLGGVAQRAQPVITPQPINAQRSSGTLSTILTTLVSCSVAYSAITPHAAITFNGSPCASRVRSCPPGKVATEVVPMSHSCGRPVTQWRQRPQLATKLVTTGRSW